MSNNIDLAFPAGENMLTRPWDTIRKCGIAVLMCIGIVGSSSCSIRTMAVNSMADALSEGGSSVYASDNDPELVGQALPFSLKMMETVLISAPRHKKLLIATSSAFVQYTHAFVLPSAETTQDLAAAREQRMRAKRLFLRARQYGLRALDIDHAGIADSLMNNRLSAVDHLGKEDVAAMYWTAAAWGSAISVAKTDMALVASYPSMNALIKRAVQLDEAWGQGSLHEFLIVLSAAQPESEGGGFAAAEKHFHRAMELNNGRSVAPKVYMAESVCIPKQDRTRFKALLEEVLSFDPDRYPENRLANLMAQRKAQRLLADIDNLFLSE